MNFIKTILFFVLVSTPFHFAQALDLEEARQKKLVIEQPDGYLKANSPTAQKFC